MCVRVYVWSGANRTAIVCGCVPHFFGGCSFESGTGERVRKPPMHLTVLDERQEQTGFSPSVHCAYCTPLEELWSQPRWGTQSF